MFDLCNPKGPPPVPAPCALRGPHRPDLLREECLADILAATARRRPEHPALIWGSRTITYRELAADSAAVGAGLAAHGLGPGRVAGLFLPRGVELLTAQAGITQSGVAWLPFDADTPLERVKTCLESAGAAGLVTMRDWLPRLTGLPVPVWAVEDLRTASPKPGHSDVVGEVGPVRTFGGRPAGLETRDTADLEVCGTKNPPTTSGGPEPNPGRPATARPEDPAYVIYTSGSTGQPKGIAISQRSICHFLRSENAVLGARDRPRLSGILGGV